MELPLAIVTLRIIRPEDSRAPCEQKNESLDIRACLGVNPLDMVRTPYWASEGKHSTIPYQLTLTPSSVYHSTRHRTALFLSIQCHLNDH